MIQPCTASSTQAWFGWGPIQKSVFYGLNFSLLNRKKHHTMKFFPEANVYVLNYAGHKKQGIGVSRTPAVPWG